MSDTPKTDERTYSACNLGSIPVVHADFARQLERENAALNWAIKRIELLSFVKANSELDEAIRATIEEAKKEAL